MIMKQMSNIRELLDRYWDGETTLEEERFLKAFFAREDIPEEYRQEARWFRILQSEQSVQMPGARRIALPVRRFGWYGMAAAAAVVLLTGGVWWWTNQPEPEEQPIVEIHRPDKNQKQVVSSPTVVVTSGGSEKQREMTETPVRKTKNRTPTKVESSIPSALVEDTCDDPEQALAEIKAALALVSSKINKSKHTLEKGLQEVDHVDVLLKRSM